VNLQNIDAGNLALFQINFTVGPPVYVITLSDSRYEKYLARPVDLKRSYLNFGHAGKMPTVGFLETATGVETSIEKGYVMIRSGSITGISTNLDITKADAVAGQVDIIIYKNGVQIGFGNTLIATSMGVKTDYDIQSQGIITFVPGDIISVYVGDLGNVDWQDVTTLIEITTQE